VLIDRSFDRDPPEWLGSLIQGKRDDSGLMYMRNRYYDPNTGRFTQEDPIGLAGGLNLYGFANGDPINFSDPYGLKTCPPECGAIHAVSSAAFGGLGVLAGGTVGSTVPVGGTVIGAVAGGAGGAAFGLAAANVAVGTAELVGGVINELHIPMPRPVRKAVEVAVGVWGWLTGNPPPRSTDPPPIEQVEERGTGSTPPPQDPEDPESQ
jgi:RHS repeat-associated protein